MKKQESKRDRMAPATKLASRSLTNLPTVTITDMDNHSASSDRLCRPTSLCTRLMDQVSDVCSHPHSHPGTPQLRRKAFSTFVGDMRYIIGNYLPFSLFFCLDGINVL